MQSTWTPPISRLVIPSISRQAFYFAALNQVYKQAKISAPFNINHDKMIILSDQHRGGRNNADEFLRSESTYLTALKHYLEHGYTLIVLGDAEELWKTNIPTTLSAHQASLALEREFHLDDRYVRFWGNHDWLWQFPAHVQRWLQPIFVKPLNIIEALRLKLVDGAHDLGEILITHGHQGTFDSDYCAAISRQFVRHIWQRIQHITKWSATGNMNLCMPILRAERLALQWTAQHPQTMLLTAHTHRPMIRDTYLNSGCCCYADGTISGIELAEGEMRQIAWVNNPLSEQQTRHVYLSKSLIFI